LAKNDLISLAEAASLSGISAGHLRLLAKQARLKARKIGRNWVTTEAAVLAYARDEAKRAKDPWKHKR
jgi:hypothetical protein